MGSSSSSSSSSVEDTNFSTFADSLESDLSDDDDDGNNKNNKSASLSASTSATSSRTVGSATKMKNRNTIDGNSNSASSTPTSTFGGDEGQPWQTKLDKLLDPKTNLADRQLFLSELLTSNDKIRDSVLDALTNRKLDPLLTPTQKKLQEGTQAVVRQLANDILPQIALSAEEASLSGRGPSVLSLDSLPSNIESIGTRFFSAVTNQIQKNLVDLQDDLTDPINKIPKRLEMQREALEKQRDEVLQEARNVFLEKPEGLEEPPYTIVQSSDLYEIRQYEAYTAASTRTTSSSSSGSSSSDPEGGANSVNVFDDGMAAAFNTLASYIFGENDESKAMSMTTPVTTTSSGDMRFYISPNGIDDGRFPQPKESTADSDTSTTSTTTSTPTTSSTSLGLGLVDDNKVEIIQIPSAFLAVRKFRGFVTDGEVARQKDTMLQALAMDDIELDVAHGAIVPHVVFQYNPPYTLPMVRGNEIGIPVKAATLGNYDDISLKGEWIVDDTDADADSHNEEEEEAPSDIK